jgi:hypothetical protein
MTTKLTKSVILTLEDGDEIVLTESEQETVRPNNTAVITCDGPRCGSRHDEIAVLTINDEQARNDPDATPDGVFKWFRVGQAAEGGTEKIWEFCSPQCMKDFLDYEYVEPLSPREKSAQLRNNTKVTADKILSRFDYGDGISAALSQADGAAA